MCKTIIRLKNIKERYVSWVNRLSLLTCRNLERTGEEVLKKTILSVFFIKIKITFEYFHHQILFESGSSINQ